MSIPLRNIDLESDNEEIYAQFYKIISQTKKECNFCLNNREFINIEFPVKHWIDGVHYLEEMNELITMME